MRAVSAPRGCLLYQDKLLWLSHVETIQVLFNLKTLTENALSNSDDSRPSPSPGRRIVNLVLPNSPRSRAPSPARAATDPNHLPASLLLSVQAMQREVDDISRLMTLFRSDLIEKAVLTKSTGST